MISAEDALELYFKAYREQRIDDVLAWFVPPGLFISDAESDVALTPMPTKTTYQSGVQQVLDWHRQIGAARSRIVRQNLMALSPRITCIHVAVDVETSEGEKLYDFESVYTFVSSAGSWRIASAVFNQIPRLLACVRERQGA